MRKTRFLPFAERYQVGFIIDHTYPGILQAFQQAALAQHMDTAVRAIFRQEK